jgi:hypothetical protein
MKFKTSNLFGTFFWCWFMGITAISIGFGAVFPSMNLIAKPFICPNGAMTLDKQGYNPYPGKVVTTITWYCVDKVSGAQKELGIFPMSLYAGTIYGVLLFIVVEIGMMLSANRKPTPVYAYSQGNAESIHEHLRSSEETLARMRELKDLRTSNLISEAEYEEKRAEILRSI